MRIVHTVDQEWVSQVIEPAIEPDLPIIDPHHHFWVREDDAQTYILKDLLSDFGGHNIRQTVFIECNSMYRADGPTHLAPVGETEFVQGIAAQSASGQFGDVRAAAGIVGFADLTLGDRVVEVLESHLQASQERFRGIRHQASWDPSDQVPNSRIEPPPGLFLSKEFRRGFQYLSKYNLSFEGWFYHPQIDELTDLAQEFEDTTIILNHLGGPLGIGPYANNRSEVFETWRSSVARLAKCSNVFAKVGGIQMPLNGYGWHEQELPPTSDQLLEKTRDWYLTIIDLFGPERCMFESNFPVDKASCSYSVLWNHFKKLSRSFSPSDRTSLFHDTALNVYRLEAR